MPGRHRVRALLLSSRIPPYLVLLRVGFTLPAALPSQRCALTAPFHPYPLRGADLWTSPAVSLHSLPEGGAAAVCFLWHWPSTGFDTRVPDVIRHTALRSSDFPPPEPSHPGPGSDRPVLLPVSVYSNAASRPCYQQFASTKPLPTAIVDSTDLSTGGPHPGFIIAARVRAKIREGNL